MSTQTNCSPWSHVATKFEVFDCNSVQQNLQQNHAYQLENLPDSSVYSGSRPNHCHGRQTHCLSPASADSAPRSYASLRAEGATLSVSRASGSLRRSRPRNCSRVTCDANAARTDGRPDRADTSSPEEGRRVNPEEGEGRRRCPGAVKV